MRKHIFINLLVVAFLCLFSSTALAQDADAIAPPTQPLMPCPADASESTEGICDLLVTSAEDIVGNWAVYFNSEPAVIRYNADGTWLIADRAENTGAPVEGYPTGVFSFDENGIFTSTDPFTPTEILPEECRSAQYMLRVIKVDGQPVALNHALIDDCFALRRTDWAYAMLWIGDE